MSRFRSPAVRVRTSVAAVVAAAVATGGLATVPAAAATPCSRLRRGDGSHERGARACGRGAGRADVRRPGLQQDDRLPPRLHRRGHPCGPPPRRAVRLHRHGHRGRDGVHRRQPRPVRGCRVDVHDQRRAQRRAADRLRELHQGRWRLRRRPRRLRHRVHVAVVRPARRRLLPEPPRRHPDRDDRRRGQDHAVLVRAAGPVGAHGRVVQLPEPGRPRGQRRWARLQPPRQQQHQRHRLPRRVDLRRERRQRHRRRPPDRLVPGVRRRPQLLHRRRAHRRVVLRAALPPPPPRRDPVRRGRGARRLHPAGTDGRRLRAASTLAKGADKTGEPIAHGGAARPPRPAHLARRPRVADDAERDDLAGGDDPGLLPRRGRPAGHRDRRRLRDQPLGLRLLRAAAVDARRRRARRRHPGRVRRLTRATTSSRGSSWPTTGRSTSRPSRRSSRSRPTAASAATPAARSTSTPQGNLYLSTGDDSNPFESDGYTPIDERPRATRPSTPSAAPPTPTTCAASCCASRSTPTARYTIPDGNLFAPGTTGTRPEIYAMGFRNPFRFAVDARPAGSTSATTARTPAAPTANRGPGGQVEFNLIKSAGNYGWPYCHGKNDAYNDFDFATGVSGREVRLRRARNNSPAQHRPDEPAAGAAGRGSPTTAAASPQFGCGSESPMGGPTYHFDAANPSHDQVPRVLRRQELRLRVRPRLDPRLVDVDAQAALDRRSSRSSTRSTSSS